MFWRERLRFAARHTQCSQTSFHIFHSHSVPEFKTHISHQWPSCRQGGKQFGGESVGWSWRISGGGEQSVQDSSRGGTKSDRGRKGGSARIVSSLQKRGDFKGLNSPEGGCD